MCNSSIICALSGFRLLSYPRWATVVSSGHLSSTRAGNNYKTLDCVSAYVKRILAPLVFFAAPIGGALVAHAQQAVTYQIDPAHDGAVTMPVFNSTPTELWSVNLGQTVSYPLIANGQIFVTTGVPGPSTSHLYAINERTGATNWSVSLTGSQDTAAYDNGTVFVAVSNGSSSTSTMNAYNAVNGSLIWSQPLTGQSFFTTAPVATNGTVFIVGSESGGTLYALNESTGTIQFTVQGLPYSGPSPTVAGNSVYVGMGPQNFSFNSTTGAKNWQQGTPSGSTKIPAAYYNGNLYPNYLQTLSSISAATGTASTTFTTLSNILDGDAFAGGMGYAVKSGSDSVLRLEGFSATTGSEIWTSTLPGQETADAPIVVNGTVFDLTDLGNLVEFGGADGNLLYTFNTGQTPIDGPIGPETGLAVGDGLLAVPSVSTLTVFAIPEPSSAVLFLTAALPLAIIVRRRLRG